MSPLDRFRLNLPDNARLESRETPLGRLRTIRREGGGRPVIGVPGIPTFIGDWTPLLRALPADDDVTIVERAGYGASARVEAEADIDAQVAAVASLLPPASDGPQAVLVGHSYGSVIALLTALAHPGRVAGVLSISGPSDPRAYPAALGAIFGGAPAAALAQGAGFLPKGILRAMAIDASRLQENLERLADALPGIDRPVMLVHGDWDHVAPASHAEHRLELIPKDLRVGLHRVPAALHNLVRSHPAPCARGFQKLADRIDGGSF